MSWYVYIVKCRDGKLYTGVTSNLKRRVKDHNDGSACNFTKSRRPVELVYKKEYPSRKNACIEEIRIKGFSRKKKLKLIKSMYEFGAEYCETKCLNFLYYQLSAEFIRQSLWRKL